MKLVMKRKITLEIISFLFILLFLYVSFSKLLDFQRFTVQIGQSPMLTGFGSIIPWLVIVGEIGISILLMIPRLRLVGFYAAFSLMVMFTAYIIAILNYSTYIPCSCGGILEKLGWTEHLIFNVFFIALALIAILLTQSTNEGNHERDGIFTTKWMPLPKTLSMIILCFFLSTASVSGLMFLSHDLVHYNNSFVRQFPPHAIDNLDTCDIEFNSYYFAGGTGRTLYLGNYTAPLHALTLNARLDTIQTVNISLKDDSGLAYKFMYLRVDSPQFYLFDGSEPANLRGKVDNWVATPYLPNLAYYADAEPINASTLVIRTTNVNKEYTLGIERHDNPEVRLVEGILEKQIDGRFCVDGMLLHNREMNLVLYLYYYRNQFLVMDEDLTLINRFNTIDTTSKAKIEVTQLSSSNAKTFSAPPLLTNKKSSTWKNFLFVNSGLMARNEDRNIFDKTSVIDVYDIRNGSYRFSFYIRDFKGHRLKDFAVYGNRLFCIHDRYIISYSLTPKYFEGV